MDPAVGAKILPGGIKCRLRERNSLAGRNSYAIPGRGGTSPILSVRRAERIRVVPVVREERKRVSEDRCSAICSAKSPAGCVVIALQVDWIFRSNRKPALVGAWANAEIDGAAVDELECPAEKEWRIFARFRAVVDVPPRPDLRRSRNISGIRALPVRKDRRVENGEVVDGREKRSLCIYTE